MTLRTFLTSSIILIIGAVATPSNASSQPSFYVGGSAGMSMTNAKYNGYSMGGNDAAGTYYPAGGDKPYNINASKSNIKPIMDLMAGFGYQLSNNIYFGAEIYGGIDFNKKMAYNGYSLDSEKSFPVITVKRNGFLGLAARFGYMFGSQALLYTRFAAEGSRFEAQSDLSAAAKYNVPLDASQADVNQTEFIKQKRKNSINFSTGIGTDYFLSKNLFMRAEASYLFGPSINFIQNKNVAKPMRGIYLNHKVKINQSILKIGLGYKF